MVETIWLSTVERLRSKIYSRCRCDATDNIAPKDIDTSNSSIGFNDAMIVIMTCIKMCQRVCGSQKNFGGLNPRMLSVATELNVLEHLIIFKVQRVA